VTAYPVTGLFGRVDAQNAQGSSIHGALYQDVDTVGTVVPVKDLGTVAVPATASDFTAVASIGSLPVGRYEFRVWLDGHPSAVTIVNVVDWLRNLGLDGTTTAYGVAHAPAGTALAGSVDVSAQMDGPRLLTQTVTDATGGFIDEAQQSLTPGSGNVKLPIRGQLGPGTYQVGWSLDGVLYGTRILVIDKPAAANTGSSSPSPASQPSPSPAAKPSA
jgi:hypothetical protein